MRSMHQIPEESAGSDVKTSVDMGFKAPISSRNVNLTQGIGENKGIQKSNTNVYKFDDEDDSVVNLDTMGPSTTRDNQKTNDDASMYELDSQIMKTDEQSVYNKRGTVDNKSFKTTYRGVGRQANNNFKQSEDGEQRSYLEQNLLLKDIQPNNFN